jgi:hypothetical protein
MPQPTGRPKPQILLSQTNKKYVATEILESTATWAVYYQDKPFNLRLRNTLLDNVGKHKRTVYSLPGHAFALMRRLNALFRTRDFSVWELTVAGGRKLQGQYPQEAYPARDAE